MARPIDNLIGWLKGYLSTQGVVEDVAEEWAQFYLNPTPKTLDELSERLKDLGLATDYYDSNVARRWEEYKGIVEGKRGSPARVRKAGSLKLVYRLASEDGGDFEYLAPSPPDKGDVPFRYDEISAIIDMMPPGRQISVVTGYPRQDIESYIIPGLKSYFKFYKKRFLYADSKGDVGKEITNEFLHARSPDVVALVWRKGMERDKNVVGVLQFGLLVDPLKKLILIVNQERPASNRRMAEGAIPLISRALHGEPYRVPVIGIFPKLLNVEQAACHLFGEKPLQDQMGAASLAQSYVPFMLLPYLDWVRDVAKKYAGEAAIDEVVMAASKKMSERISRDAGSPVSLMSQVTFGNLARADKIRQLGEGFEIFELSSDPRSPKDPKSGGADGKGFGGVIRGRDSGIVLAPDASIECSAAIALGANPVQGVIASVAPAVAPAVIALPIKL